MYFLIVLNVSPVLLGSMFLFYFLTGVLGLLKKKFYLEVEFGGIYYWGVSVLNAEVKGVLSLSPF